MSALRADRAASPAARCAAVLGALALLAAPVAIAQSPAAIQGTKHNLSVSGPGPIKSLTENRICVFCHTPHNATPESPLWNRALEPRVYDVYASPTLGAGPLPQPSGPTKLCLSCHDGTVALGAVVNPPAGFSMTQDLLPPGSLSNFGLSLAAHHPVSFSYSSALPNPELAPSPPADLVFGAADEVHCITCHDPHRDSFGDFLVKDNRFSALCVTCHEIPGWAASDHATSGEPVGGILPRPPKTEPDWATLGEWGCEACHTPHFAPTAEQLFNFTPGPPEFTCTSAGCHSGEPGPPHAMPPPGTAGLSSLRATSPSGRADIAGQMEKPSAHKVAPGVYSTSSRRSPGRRIGALSGVGCADCHNPHVANDAAAEAPDVSGRLMGVSGVDRNGVAVAQARYEYEICFKCHADNSGDFERVPRVLGSTNTRLDFAPGNSSSHPVVGVGGDAAVPSLLSTARTQLGPGGAIYCSSCHADDESVSEGPHGSVYAPILRERYDFDGGPGGYDAFALCYRCHDQSSILGNQSFRPKSARTTASGGGHAGHLALGASCAVCHDPHGVPDRGALRGGDTGSHTHLINFDVRNVQGLDGNPVPIYADLGPGTGSCTLMCHGFRHENLTYP